MNCYLVGTGNRNLNNPLVWSSTSGGTPADVLGSELITNAADREFSSDTGFWIKGTGVTIADGLCHFNNIPSYGSSLKSGIVVNPGRWVRIDFTVLNYISGSVLIWDELSGASNMITSNGIYSVYFKTSTGRIVFSSRTANATFDLDNVSIKEVLSVPNSSNPAIIDANSSIANGDVLSLSAQFDCAGFDCSAAAYTFTLSNAAHAFNVYGDFKDSTKRINGFSSTGYLYFKGSSNIYSNGATQGWNRIYFDGVGKTFINQDDWNVGSTSPILANGEWKTNGKIITIQAAFQTATGSKTLTLDSSLFQCNVFANYSPTNFIFNYNTSTVSIVSGSTNFITGSFTFYNLKLYQSGNVTSGLIDSNQIVNNVFEILGTNASNYRLLVASNTIGTPRTITCNGTIVASNVDFRDIILAGTANRDLSAISGGSGDCGGNSGITFTPSQTQYFKHTSGACQWSDATKWVTSSGGSIQGRVPLPQDDPIFDQNSFTGASTLSVNCPRIGRSLNMEGVNQAVTFTLANSINLHGGFVLGNNISIVGIASISFYGIGDFYINTYGKAMNNIINFYKGSYINLSDINNNNYILVDSPAVFINNNFTVTTTAITYGNLSGIVKFNNCILNLIGTVGVIIANNNVGSEFNCTIIANPPSGSSNLFFTRVNGVFDKVIFSGQHTGNFIIASNSTFNELVIEKGRKVQVTGGTTQTISPTGKLIADGTPTEQIQITSTNTTPFNLVYAGTGFHQVNYCNISYCNATADRFYAGKNSTDGGNNTGWKFRSYLAQNTQIL